MKKLIIALAVCIVLLFSCEEIFTDMESDVTNGTESVTDIATETEEIFTAEETEPAPIETDAKEEPVTEPPHEHSFIEPTCTAPKTCSVCGVTEGDAAGHSFIEPTCTAPKTCSECGVTEGDAMGHYYSGGKCTNCGANDPNYVSEPMVWIPTNGGTKYHSKSSCSKMVDPSYVTKSEAIALGFGPCGRCY